MAEGETTTTTMATTGDGKEIAGAKRARGVPYTVSIAVCSSMVDNAQSMELATMLAGQVARCAGIFCADEIVVVDDYGQRGGGKEISSCAAFLARVLQYMETPQYLRRTLIKNHAHLKHVGLLPPLNAPHHPRSTEWTKYREGVVLPPENDSAGPSEDGDLSLINVGLDAPVKAHKRLRARERVTVRMKDKGFPAEPGAKFYRGKVVSRLEPRSRKGTFWGYDVRIARSLSEALSEGPYEGGYDLKIGTSERGDVFDPSNPAKCALPDFKHCLVAFGAVDGLEFACANDALLGEGKDPRDLFHLYLNTCPAQGTRTIRAEEAITITMALLSTKFPEFFSQGLGSGAAVRG